MSPVGKTPEIGGAIHLVPAAMSSAEMSQAGRASVTGGALPPIIAYPLLTVLQQVELLRLGGYLFPHSLTSPDRSPSGGVPRR